MTISYLTSKAEVHAADNWDEMMKFIIDNRPLVVYQFWIDTVTNKSDTYKMLFSKVVPAPDSFTPSEV